MAKNSPLTKKPKSASTAGKKPELPQNAMSGLASNTVHYCNSCGERATKTTVVEKFFISYSPYNSYTNRLPICKSCVIKFSTSKDKQFVPEKFLDILKFIDRPLKIHIYEASIKEVVRDVEAMSGYCDKNTVHVKYADRLIGYYFKNLSFMYKSERWADGDLAWTVQAPSQSEASKGESEDFEQLELFDAEDMCNLWGAGLTPQDYMFLEQRYSKLSSMAKIEFESDVMLIRQICLEELELRKIREAKGDTAKKLDTITKLMANASIRPTDIKNANSDLLNDSYGKWLQTIEENEPAEYFKDKPLYEDYDGIKKYFLDWVLRPLRNILKGDRVFDVSGDE